MNFYKNQLIWRKNFVLSDASKFYAAKLTDKFLDSFMISKCVSRDLYTLKNLEGTWHVRYLKAQLPVLP